MNYALHLWHQASDESESSDDEAQSVNKHAREQRTHKKNNATEQTLKAAQEHVSNRYFMDLTRISGRVPIMMHAQTITNPVSTWTNCSYMCKQ
jgi:hypothetical protein